jgi:hypothetical protein
MQPVPEDERVAELRRMDLPKSIVGLATRAIRLPVFPSIRTPRKVYRGIKWSGRKAAFVPLWEVDDVVTAVRWKGTALEFFRLLRRTSSRWSLGHSVQAFLATLFHDPLNEYYDEPEDYGKGYHARLKAAGKSLGFRHFAELDAVFADNHSRPGEALPRAYRRFLRALEKA